VEQALLRIVLIVHLASIANLKVFLHLLVIALLATSVKSQPRLVDLALLMPFPVVGASALSATTAPLALPTLTHAQLVPSPQVSNSLKHRNAHPALLAATV
jgi:hypothetical protein